MSAPREEEADEVDRDAPPTPGERGSTGRTLPPPAFPPGPRRREVAERVSNLAPAPGTEEQKIPRDAFISPDDPIRKEGRGIPEDAFISPDDPVVTLRRDEDGEATGLGLLATPSSEPEPSRRQTPNIHELPYLLDQLAEQLNESGEKALEVHTEMGHFQAALRSFLKGYLAGNRD